MRVLLIRHAQTVWNASGKAQGQADPALSDTGREQCQLVADRLAHVGMSALFSSDLLRAKETAEAVASRHQGLEVELDRDLREVDLGEWEGADRESLRRGWPELYAAWRLRPSWDLVPGGEGSGAFRSRVMACFGRIAAGTPDDRTLAVVTHIGVIRTLLSAIVGAEAGDLFWPWAVDNTGLTTLQGPADVELWPTPHLEVMAINDDLHLHTFPAPMQRA